MSQNRILILLFILSVALVIFVSPHASLSPDGLERVAEDNVFAERANVTLRAPAPDYSFPGLPEGALSTSLAGLVGVGAVFLSVFLAGRALTARRKRN